MTAAANPAATSAAAVGDIAAKGKVLRVDAGLVVFQPLGSNYELHLLVAGGGTYAGPMDRPVECVIRAVARKVYTVPSGGNFIQPIFGPPRVIQGRVRGGDEKQIVVHAGVPMTITLPADALAIDLARGPIAVGSMVNVIAMPGATAEFR